MNFNIDTILQSLDIMWKGMASIFAVIIIITLLVMFFQFIERIISAKKERE